MSYSNDQTEIRMGLTNYVGALLKSSKFEGKAAKHSVAAILIEEAMKLSQDEDKVYDIYVLKPMLRGTLNLFKQRKAELSALIPQSRGIQEQILNYEELISKLEKLISMLQ